MHFVVLAVDYDETIAEGGIVDPATLAALEAVKASGRRLVLVTGRELPDLARACDRLDLFDLVVAENGGLLYDPRTREETLLAEPPDAELVQRLDRAGVAPLSAGRGIVATRRPHEGVVLEAIRELGLELQIIFNKGAVMVLPAGINKATGLTAALEVLGLSRHNVVGIGDAENDHAFLSICGCAVAVANALPALKADVDLVTVARAGAGVAEVARLLAETDLAPPAVVLRHHRPLLGMDGEGEVRLDRAAAPLLIAGSSGGGKSTVAQGLVERLLAEELQCCIVDPEGDFAELEGVVSVGGPRQKPELATIRSLLSRPDVSIAVSLLAIEIGDRPTFFASLLAEIVALRVETGRPHWLVLDEAHHVLPASRGHAPNPMPDGMPPAILITVEPTALPAALLKRVAGMLAVGREPATTLAGFCAAAGQPVPAAATPADEGMALYWRHGQEVVAVRLERPAGKRRRHARKYAEGELGADKSFYFRGPDGRLNLRAQNLLLFRQIAEGVDDATWLHHLHAGDYSRWFAEAIKDEDLAAETSAIEQAAHATDAGGSRAAVFELIAKRYTAPARGT